MNVPTNDLRERLAVYAHETWSGWIEYMLGKFPINEDGSITFPNGYVEALMLLATTPYPDLSADQKDNDRHEADRMLSIFNTSDDRTGEAD